MLRDVECRAIAARLTYQNQVYLKDRGDAWACVIVQRMKGDPEILAEVVDKVKNEFAKGDMALIRSEAVSGMTWHCHSHAVTKLSKVPQHIFQFKKLLLL